jgi:hypothetical protein
MQVLSSSKIIRRLTFFILSLTTRLIQNICANIVKFKLLLKNFINEPCYNKISDILHNFLNKMRNIKKSNIL